MAEHIIGVDLGGTKIVSGIINESGEIIGEPVKLLTKADEAADLIVNRMAEAINQSISAAKTTINDIRGIGIGSPGPLDIKKGIILTTQNLPTLHYYPLREKIEGIFGLPVFLNNDANCFALGEASFGAVKNIKNAVGITLGTGFGCGIIINGKIYNGATGTAAEIDLCPYLDGNLEDFISGQGVVNIYRKIAGGWSSPPEIAQMARNGQREAQQAWEEFGVHLGVSLAYVVNILDPEAIIIGGSLSNAYDLFYAQTIKTVEKNINPIPKARLKIEKAQLANNAGFIGAACLVLKGK